MIKIRIIKKIITRVVLLYIKKNIITTVLSKNLKIIIQELILNLLN